MGAFVKRRANLIRLSFLVIVLLVLGATAALKAYSLAYDRLARDVSPDPSFATLLFGLVVELLLIGLLVSRASWTAKRAAMVIVFGGFAGFSLVRSLIGTGYCGCAGSWELPSALFLVFDLVLIAFLCSPWLNSNDTLAESRRGQRWMHFVESVRLHKCGLLFPCSFAAASIIALVQVQWGAPTGSSQVLIDQVMVGLYGQDYQDISKPNLDVLWVDQKCLHCREMIRQVFAERSGRPGESKIPIILAGTSRPPFSIGIPADLSDAILIHIDAPISVLPGTLLHIRQDEAVSGSNEHPSRGDLSHTWPRPARKLEGFAYAKGFKKLFDNTLCDNSSGFFPVSWSSGGRWIACSVCFMFACLLSGNRLVISF